VADLTSLGDGWYLVSDGGRQVTFAVAHEAGVTWVFANGQVAKIETHTDAPRRARGRSAGTVMSPMPATVVAINIAAGDAVTEGQTLIVLEAMKMELPIKAPRGGVVKAIHCVKGDLVQPGINLLDID
jgi:biotin carboxyl carrier protein